jgi:hypothetical protein
MKKDNVKAGMIMGIVMLLAFQLSCKKGWLDAKPSDNIAIPTTLTDFQGLLDNTGLFGLNNNLIEVSSDDYYTPYANWQAIDGLSLQNAYIWASDIFEGQINQSDWDRPYQQIFYCNNVLDGLSGIPLDSVGGPSYNNVEGQALFLRSYAFYNLVREFAVAYDSSTANTDLGIPLRLSADISEKIARSTVQESYDKIIGDLKMAVTLLPINALYQTRGSKLAAYAMLSRVFLSIRDYDNSLLYADSCLRQNETLLDYNSLNPGKSFPIPKLNNEILFNDGLSSTSILNQSNLKVDSLLYNSYDSTDLRKSIFFKLVLGLPTFKGSYGGGSIFFTGLTIPEMYLDRAEGYARNGQINLALNDLNALLTMRYKQETFIPIIASSPQMTLQIILTERRKELIYRSLRWTDLRRLNKEGYNITLTRILNGQVYTLPPNDPKYTLPIPPDVIQLSGIQQNPR